MFSLPAISRLRRRVCVLAAIGACFATSALASQDPSPGYIGARACGACHADALKAWTGSHHDLAMQQATPETVLGDFADASLTHHGVVTRFSREGDTFWIESEDGEGKRQRFRVAYVFGVEPLQQYLVAFPDGRMQAFVHAWDTRPRAAGGQRWFSVYGDEVIPAGDVLHWTGLAQNWNHQCADCHSTDLRKGYDASNDRFETRWSEIDVACEACHGPGAVHRERMQSGLAKWRKPGETGLTVEFESVREATYPEDPKTGLPVRTPARAAHAEAEVCARCHSRRTTLVEAARPGTPLHDTHRVSALEPGLYFADGQILDEVYVYGSFVQSAMHAAGVSCSDCHEPHSAKLRAEGNALCARCHTPARYDAKKHHHHAPGTAGAACVSCHMPSRTYMQVDDRRDHSLRIPRPDLSLETGAPNACNDCHSSMTSAWAAKQIESWKPGERPTHYGEAIAAGQKGAQGAEQALIDLIAAQDEPAIARATAVSLLPRVATAASLPTLERGLRDGDAMVRAHAARAFEPAPPEIRGARLAPLLDDPARIVRWEAAALLVDVDGRSLPPNALERRDEILAEYEAALRRDADRPESHMNLASLAMARGELAAAEAALLQATRRNTYFVPAWVNLSDVYRAQGKLEASEAILAQGLEHVPSHPDLLHARGLARVRVGKPAEALADFERAASERPEDARYAYVYAVALFDAGRREQALAVLRRAAALHPGDREIAAFLANLEGRRAR